MARFVWPCLLSFPDDYLLQGMFYTASPAFFSFSSPLSHGTGLYKICCFRQKTRTMASARPTIDDVDEEFDLDEDCDCDDARWIEKIGIVATTSLFSSSSDTLDFSQHNLAEIDTAELFCGIDNPHRIKTVQCNASALLTLPTNIDQFQSLITVELSNNRLVQLPCELGRLKCLKHLHLKNNALDDLSLPKELQQLQQLEVINLGGNRFKQFPYQLFQMFNLREVYLGSNQIGCLPDLFETLKK